MSIRFEGRVAIVTGAGAGLGRAHALGLAARGAKVLVNDLGGAEAVAEEIRAAGGAALADAADVADFDAVTAMAEAALARWGRIDILVANAGILRDKSFAKMEMADFRKVLDVHLMGSAHCAKAVWGAMRAAGYGRIVLTTSSSGLYGNFGQANYAAAKTGMIGLMNALSIEGAKHGIRVNTISPTAATAMTEDLMPPEMLAVLGPETITPGVLHLVSEDAPERAILCAGAGCFARAYVHETEGIYLEGDELSPEGVAARWAAISDETGQKALRAAFEQTEKYAERAAKAKGVDLPPRQRKG